MIEKISISLDLSDKALKSTLLPLINREGLLNLSVEGIPYPEEIILTDNPEYSAKTGELVVAVGCKPYSCFSQVNKDPEEIVVALRRTVCYWETASMNRTSVNSLETYNGLLEELASKILKSASEKKFTSSICQSIVKDMPIAMLVINEHGVVEMMNSKAQTFFQGYDVNPMNKLAEIGLPEEFNELLSGRVEDPYEAIIGGSQITLKKFQVATKTGSSATVLLFY